MTTWTCTIHRVQFGAEAPAGATGERKECARLSECPVCAWKEKRRLIDQVSALTKQRDLLVSAIELKQEFLTQKLK
jgi:hypothetical protein